jgi:hypothetical protein
MYRHKALSRWILLLTTACLPAFAATIVITNPSFETTDPMPIPYETGFYNLGPIPGWTLVGAGPAGSWQASGPSSFTFIPDGTVIALINGGYLNQVLSDSLANSTRYTLTTAVGRRADGFSADSTIQLLAGGSVIASGTQAVSNITSGGWIDYSVSYMSGASDPHVGQPLEIRLIYGGGVGAQSNFDDVRLDATAIPEPATCMMIGAALVALALGRKKRR